MTQFHIWQWVWGLPQNLLGLILMLYHRNDRRSTYRGCTVIHWAGSGSMSLGCFSSLVGVRTAGSWSMSSATAFNL